MRRYNAREMKQRVLGDLTPQRFLRSHWQREPLFVKAAAPDIAQCFEPAMLIDLAQREEVESRLVLHRRGRWSVQHGPFSRTQLARLPSRGWSLLVQGADLHLEAARALMDLFSFVPHARQDDVMLSLSPAGGGVGPHFDSYDVFLLQGRGRRRWRIGAQRDLSLVAGAPLRILQRFRPERELMVEPGDLLYLPPRYAHEGVACTECITCSIGFRAPSAEEVVTSFLQWLPDRLELDGRYRDPGLALQAHPAEISSPMVRQLETMLRKIRWQRGTVEHFVGEHLTEPKAHVWFRVPERPLPLASFVRHAARRGVRLAHASRMLFRGDLVFINGECLRASLRHKATLIALADARKLAPWPDPPQQAVRQIYAWYRQGYVELL
jgi:50S ribosomal protein L16 3-hydroxylase